MKPYFAVFSLTILLASSLLHAEAKGNGAPDSSKQGPTQGSAQSLLQVFLAAMDASPALRIAHSQLSIGRAQRTQARAQLLPQISASGNFSDNDQSFPDQTTPDSNFDGEKYGLQLQQVLFSWQAFANRKRASYVVDQKEAEYYNSLGLLLLDTSDRYFAVLAAEDNLALVLAEREATDQQLKQAESHYRRKLIKVTDLYEVRARAATIRSDEIDAENEVALTKEALWEISGEEIAGLYRLNNAVEFPEINGSLESWVTKALQSNALLRARESAINASNQTISERRGAHYPVVKFVASRQKSDLGYENTQTAKRMITYYGIDVSVPIYSGGSSSARVKEAYHMAEIAKSEHELTRRDLVKRTRAAYLSVKSSIKRIGAAEYAVEAASASASAMRKGFTLGTVTTVDVLDALRQEFSAQRDLQQVKYAYIQALLSLKKEAGSIDKADIEEINSWLLSPGA